MLRSVTYLSTFCCCCCWWWWWWWIVFAEWLTNERPSSRDNCRKFSLSKISDTTWSGFQPAQNLNSGFVEWYWTLVITTTPRHHILFPSNAWYHICYSITLPHWKNFIRNEWNKTWNKLVNSHFGTLITAISKYKYLWRKTTQRFVLRLSTAITSNLKTLTTKIYQDIFTLHCHFQQLQLSQTDPVPKIKWIKREPDFFPERTIVMSVKGV